MSESKKETQGVWGHIDALMKSGGQITLGRMAPLDGVAVAGDDRNLYSALRRRPNETVAALMQRLDDAIGLARAYGPTKSMMAGTSSSNRALESGAEL